MPREFNRLFTFKPSCHPDSRSFTAERVESVVVFDTDQCRSGPIPCILQSAYLDHGFHGQLEAYA
jgi:hypothetical protein